MSSRSKELYKKYLSDTENSSAIPFDKSNKIFEQSKSATVKQIENNETIKEFHTEYTFYYNLLMSSLNQQQTELLLEIDEVINQPDSVLTDMIYLAGFKDGLAFKHGE
jgi:hypothetical protein